MWIYDVETLRFLAVNDAAVHTYGYSRDEFLAMTTGDCYLVARERTDLVLLASPVPFSGAAIGTGALDGWRGSPTGTPAAAGPRRAPRHATATRPAPPRAASS